MFFQLVLLSFGFLLKLSLSGCNYAVNPDMPLPLAASECQVVGDESAKLTCDGTTATVNYYASSSSCSGDAQDFTSQVVTNCDNSESCGTLNIKLTSYDAQDCSGDAGDVMEWVIIDAMPCTVLNGTGYTFAATESKLTITTWNKTDCTGVSSSMELEPGCNDGTDIEISAAYEKYSTNIIFVAAIFAALSSLMVAA